MCPLTLAQIRIIAIGNAQQLRLRWDYDPEFWRDLLVARRAGGVEHGLFRARYLSLAGHIRRSTPSCK
jgi:hypothetical protein